MNQYRGSHKQLEKMKVRLLASNFAQVPISSSNNFDVKLDGKCQMMTS